MLGSAMGSTLGSMSVNLDDTPGIRRMKSARGSIQSQSRARIGANVRTQGWVKC